MAGSLTIRRYTSDTGGVYAFKVDKSNGNAQPFGGSDPLCPVRTADYPPLPSLYKKRYVLAYNQANPRQTRKFYVGVPSIVPTLTAPGAKLIAEDYPGTNDSAGANVTWIITAYRGERVNLLPAVSTPDTGLTDGSPTTT